MDQLTSFSRSVARTSDLQGSLLLTNAGFLLIGVWATLGLAPVPFVDRDESRDERHPLALEAYADGCQAGDAAACNNLGVSYERGYGTERDGSRALALFERACRSGSAEACNNQAALLERVSDVGSAIEPIRELYRRACTQGSGLGCSNLGALYAKGKGVARDRAQAHWLFERACQSGVSIGCDNLVELETRALRH
jgi:TPR repeat protein